MAKPKLNEIILPADRWSIKVVSPVDLSHGVNIDRYGEPVVLHPGWAKSPRRYAGLLILLANNGFLPLGVDTRYAYCDRAQPQPKQWRQPRVVGNRNRYFAITTRPDNQYAYRRPTVLLDACEKLELGRRSYIGHSDGGRITALAATASPETTRKLVIVNGAGLGDSSNGLARLSRSNFTRLKRVVSGEEDVAEYIAGGIESVIYSTTHPRRTLAEKHVIQHTNTWQTLDELRNTAVDVSVLHARGDELISFDNCLAGARQRPWINFTPTDGTHSSIYTPEVHELVAKKLLG